MIKQNESIRSRIKADKKTGLLSFIFIDILSNTIEALDIPPEDIRITENTLFPGLAHPEISNAICFPFAQHYIADSPGCYTTLKDRNDLVSKYNEIANYEVFKTFSTRTIKKQLFIGLAISILIAVLLIIIL